MTSEILTALIGAIVALGVGTIWHLVKKGATAETDALDAAVKDIKGDLGAALAQWRSDMVEMKNLVYGVKQEVDRLVSDGKNHAYQLQQQGVEQARIQERVRDLEMAMWSSGRPPRRPPTGKHPVIDPNDISEDPE